MTMSSTDGFSIRNGILGKYKGEGGDVVIPEGVTGICAEAFAKCESLRSVTIPDSVTRISKGAFKECHSLKTVKLPANITRIEDDLFCDCIELGNVTIPDSVTSIGKGAFGHCISITQIDLPKGLTSIEESAFGACESCQCINIPGSVTSIGPGAFYNCNSLKTASFSAGATIIGDKMFGGCNNLTSVIIPDSVTTIGKGPFQKCMSLKDIHISPDHPAFEVVDGVLFTKEDRRLVYYPIWKEQKEYHVPQGVKCIDDSVFENCQSLVKVSLPDSLLRIGFQAFHFCHNLESINLPESITDIGGFAFCFCKLKSIKIPSLVKIINSNTFSCNDLVDVSIPYGVTAIYSSAFDCCNFTDVIIPNSVVSIGVEAFRNCEKLKNLTIPDSVKRIGQNAFSNCYNLEKVTITGASPTDTKRKKWEKHFPNVKEIVFQSGAPKEIPAPERPTSSPSYSVLNLDVDSVLNMYNTVLDLGDEMDATGTGVQLLSGGEKTTRNAFNHELGHYLLYLVGDSSIVTEDQAALLSLVLADGRIQLSTSQVKELAEGLDAPDPGEFLSLKAFLLTDIAMSKEGGKLVTTSVKSLLVIHKAFGQMLLVLNENENSRRRYEDYINQLEELVSSTNEALKRKMNMEEEDVASNKKAVGKYTAVMPTDELYSHYGKLKREADKFKRMGVQYVQNNGEEYQGLSILKILDNNGHKDTNLYRKLKTAMSDDSYDLDQTVLKMAQVFRVDESVFNSRHDDEGDIHDCLMDKKWKFSALRSFAWTLADLADREGKSIDDYAFDDLVALCAFIEEREWLNYEEGSWFDGLCGHPDIHVFYMPGKMVESGEADEICTVLSYNPIASLDAFRSDLSQLKNAMIQLHNGLLKTRNRSEKLESAAAAVLQAWCVMAMSAKVPFFSEDGPMFFFHSYPSDALNTKALPVDAKATFITKAAPKPKKAEVSSGMESVSNYEIVKGADGKERVKLGEYPVGSPITWLVLEKKGQELLLLSEFALDAKPFCDSSFRVESTNEWHGCTLRTWLNDDFYTEAFSDEERRMIMDDTHDTYKKTAAGEEETPAETDKVFLLSAREVRKYFPQERDRICKASAYAKEHGAEIEAGPNQCSWWLRSPAVEAMGISGFAASIRANGAGKGRGIYSGETCVRPVIRVKSSEFTSTEVLKDITGDTDKTSVAVTTGEERIGTLKASELDETVNYAEDECEQTSDRPLTAEEQRVIHTAQSVLANMQSQVSSTTSALEKHQENLRKQQEEKEHRIEEAKGKGKSIHDETNMLAVLLIEEALGQLNRDENEFAQIYAEDFAAYDEQELIGLRRKVMSTIHDETVIESAKEDMLDRPLDDRFSISTANYFNVGTDWNLDAKGASAIEITKLWYKESEMTQLLQKMEEYKEKTRQGVFDQLTAFRPEWSSFKQLREDLHISISSNSEPVPEAHNLFHVKQGRDLDVKITLTNPALGYVIIPVMNVFASCWKVSPEEIWDAALQNSITDSRGQSYSSRSDAIAAKAAALSQLKPPSGSAQTTTESAPVQRPATTPRQTQTVDSEKERNAVKGERIQARIDELTDEMNSLHGLFAGFKRRKLQKEIDELKEELKNL